MNWPALLLIQQSWMLGPFTKPAGANPVVTPSASSRFRSPMNDSTVAWEEYATFNPAAVAKDGKVFLLYRAEDATGPRQIGAHTSRLGLAESSDGLRFTRRAEPVLYPDTDAQRQNEWPGGVEDPRIVATDDGMYVLTYTQWNRDVPRLAVATSRDLIHWTKHGPAFAGAAGGKYLGQESKSGAILSRVQGDRVVATRVNGKYWMYWGVPNLHIATSDDLIAWTPLEDADGRLLNVLSPRPGYFDSWLVEGGPPALLTAHGIVVLYNVGTWYKHHGLARIRHANKQIVATNLPRGKVMASIAILLLLIFSKYFYLASISSYFTFYLIHKFGVSVQTAQVHLFFFLGAVAAGTFMGGPLGDRFGRKYVIWFSILGVLPFTLMLPHANLFWTGVLTVVIGLILASAFAAILVYATELMPGKVGTVAGLFFGFAFGMGGLGAALLGGLADMTSIGFVYQVCAFLPAIGLLAAFLPNLDGARRRRRQAAA